jgi:hypothetical protein
MKTFTILCITTSFFLLSDQTNASTTLFNLGSNDFDIQSSLGSFSQSSTNITWSNSVSLGDNVSGPIISGPIDLNPFTGPGWQFGIELNITGVNPSAAFTADLIDENFNFATYTGQTSSLASGIALLNFASADIGFNFSSIIGFAFTWSGDWSESGTSVVGTNFAAVPEPSSALLLGLGAAGLYLLRRRKAKD